jgi:ribonuclease HII
MPNLAHERDLAAGAGLPVAGLDEVGRGPWAGPVVACAVLLPDPLHETGGLPPALYAGLNDSKKLSAAAREALAEALPAAVHHGFGEASVAEIDDLNILQASLLAMRRALAALPVPAAGALVDGNRDPGLRLPTRLIVGGDAASASIAAASVLAKVRRDRLMAELARDHPGYGWETNAGYGTKAHRDGLERLGITPHHRTSFAPIRARLQSALKI